MSHSYRPIALAAAALLAASGSLYAADPAPAPASPEAKNCIPLSSIRDTKVLDDSTILFNMNGGETLVNHLPHRCGGLGSEKAFGYETSLSELCSTDIIWVVRQTAGRPERGASCGLGKFEPYVAPDTDEAVNGGGQLRPM